MSVLVLPKATMQALHALTGESRPDAALMLVMQDAHTYRTAQVTAGLRAFEAKYGMTFEEYRERWESEERDEDYEWDAEQDFLSWEALTTQQRRLAGISPWQP
ncbi:MAG: hypothetical protein FJ011_24140 [Chloroflexi bacterium]|nr:hypothetical protein [Chloroflexota bacterium]